MKILNENGKFDLIWTKINRQLFLYSSQEMLHIAIENCDRLLLGASSNIDLNFLWLNLYIDSTSSDPFTGLFERQREKFIRHKRIYLTVFTFISPMKISQIVPKLFFFSVSVSSSLLNLNFINPLKCSIKFTMIP